MSKTKEVRKLITQQEYWNIHSWLRRNYGKAVCCENNCGTIALIFDYALIHGKKYERKRENFKMLCKKCHYYYDDLKTIGKNHPMWGKHHNLESKKKMSVAHIGNSYGLGFKHSLETRKKMSESRKGIPKSEDHKNKISEANKGKKLSKERKEKLRIWHLGRKASVESRLKMSMSRMGKKMSQATKLNMSIAAKKRWKIRKYVLSKTLNGGSKIITKITKK